MHLCLISVSSCSSGGRSSENGPFEVTGCSRNTRRIPMCVRGVLAYHVKVCVRGCVCVRHVSAMCDRDRSDRFQDVHFDVGIIHVNTVR